MALTATTLASAANATTLRFAVTSSTGATVGGFMRVDGEYMMVVAIPVTNHIDVRSRGDRGGTAVAHTILAPVTFGLASDMVALGPRQDIPVPADAFEQAHVGANGVIPVPVRPTVFIINKASALASSTFADPGKDQDGLVVSFVGATDYAHVVTTTSVYDGTTGAHTTLTSPAYAGGSITLYAAAGKWLVLSNNLWVIS